MLFDCGHLDNFVMFPFIFFFQKAENNGLKKSQLFKILSSYFFVFA